MIALQTLTSFQIHVSELTGEDSIDKVNSLIEQLESYGITTEEQFDDAYSGCYRDEATFCEDLMSDCYSQTIDELPVWLQNAIDWEMVWHTALRFDYFTVEINSYEKYFFSSNF